MEGSHEPMGKQTAPSWGTLNTIPPLQVKAQIDNFANVFYDCLYRYRH